VRVFERLSLSCLGHNGERLQERQENHLSNTKHQNPQPVSQQTKNKLLCISVLELSVFSLVSKEMNRSIMDYISTKAWKAKRQCSMLLPAKEKFRFIFSQLSKCFVLGQCLFPGCSGFACYGVLLQTLTAQWDEPECQRVINFLLEQTNLLQKMEAVVTAKADKGDQELQLRCFCRKVLLDPWISQPQCQFWLMQLLKPWPMVSQARLLFIFYGPLTPEVIPQPWHMENVARLLVLCGDSLCYTVLASKALNGRLTEVSRIIVYIILVHERDRFNMAAVVKLVLQISRIFSTPTERFFFIQKMEDMFSEITREFYEMSVRGKRKTIRVLGRL
uniref:F-box protein 47 n=1 Tax=Cynoglossus semilaevis TaxID=244447 RepID=A0A3P8W1Z7_CYNSE